MEVRSKVKKILGQWRHKKVQNDWTNKNIVVFGDSIVAGQELVREETPYRDAVYAKLASYYLNAHKLENFAETGTGQFKGQHHLDHLTGWTHSFEGSIQHYHQEIQQADVVLIAYGNNDWKQPNPDGSLHTLDEVKVKLRENIQRIRLINHHVQLVGVLETLAFRNHKPAWHLEGPNGFTYQEMLSAFIEVYQECDVPIFDIRDYHLGNHMDEYVDDRDHFTLPVHKQIAKCLTDFVRHDYKSPVQHFGKTIKLIYTDHFFEDAEIRGKLFDYTLKMEIEGKNVEILTFEYHADFEQKLLDLLQNYSLPKNMIITNIFQYYAEPLNYIGRNYVKLRINDEGLINQNDILFLKIEDDKFMVPISSKEWSKRLSMGEFAINWLRHYLSYSDDIVLCQNDKIQFLKLEQLEEVDTSKLSKLIKLE
ncbi:SGNH/GDSL hydrolase family protein [Weissella paramesenteroides]|nr:SGNH/GDSL hydrolase family protein [Weissella paramesenteroides]